MTICPLANAWPEYGHSTAGTEWLNKKSIQALQWSRQSQDFNSMEMLLQVLNRAVYKKMPANLNKLKQRFKEDVPEFLHDNVRKSYRELLLQVNACGSTRSFCRTREEVALACCSHV